MSNLLKCTTPKLDVVTPASAGCTPKLEKVDLTNWYNLNVKELETCVWQEENGAPITDDADEVFCIDDV